MGTLPIYSLPLFFLPLFGRPLSSARTRRPSAISILLTKLSLPKGRRGRVWRRMEAWRVAGLIDALGEDLLPNIAGEFKKGEVSPFIPIYLGMQTGWRQPAEVSRKWEVSLFSLGSRLAR